MSARRHRKLEELIELNALIGSTLDTTEILKSLTLSALALLDCDSAEIWAAEEDLWHATELERRPAHFQLVCAAGATEDLPVGSRLKANAGQLERNGDSIFFAQDLDRSFALFADSYRPSVCEAAFFLAGQRTGCITVTRDGRRRFQNDDLYFLERLGVQAGISLSTSALVEQLRRERDRAQQENAVLKGSARIIGRSDQTEQLRQTIELIGPSQASVLLVGERGTGKELVSESLHRASGRSNAPLVKVNCAGIVETLLESELFGYEKGAFTGADKTRRGLIEEAHGGTLFLDEVGELSASMQVKLLRFLQEGTIRRVGGQQEFRVDVRVIAATNRDVAQDSEGLIMRRDLYDRLATVVIQLPPLRERGADIALLANHFLERYRDLERKPDITGFHPSVIRKLEQHDWPGNVRELENAVHRMVIMTDQGQIEGAEYLHGIVEPQAMAAPERKDGLPGPFIDARARFEEDYVRRALHATHGNISQAANLAGIDRGNFKIKMRKYKVKAQDYLPA